MPGPQAIRPGVPGPDIPGPDVGRGVLWRMCGFRGFMLILANNAW